MVYTTYNNAKQNQPYDNQAELMNNKTYIIAEAGVNHNGDLSRAYEMISVAAKAGVDAIKFQTFIPEQLATASAEKAEYQKTNDNTEGSQLDMLKGLALSFSDHKKLLKECQKANIDFLSSPFDLESADFLINDLKLTNLKLGSGELTNAPLLLKIARHKVNLILSTGMATLNEIDDALAVLAFGYCHLTPPANLQQCQSFFKKSVEAKKELRKHVTLLHCTTSYPCADSEVNLNALKTINEHTELQVGYSDHTEGTLISSAAVAIGAQIIEKHFTLDRNLPGPDHLASIEPDELTQLVNDIRKIERALGSKEKLPTISETKNKDVARKSLVAGSSIKKGELYTENNLTTKRPGTGISPFEYWDTLGSKASKDYEKDELIET